MYGGASDGEGIGVGHDAGAPKKIPSASSMPWVRNLRRYVGSGAGLGSEALMDESSRGRKNELEGKKKGKNQRRRNGGVGVEAVEKDEKAELDDEEES
ncbi:hypothetical protein ZIOFF_011436 [Zingiber officinale]|uniref:Uncharacterized protein n=1 Tax=Zingiber officinale TaxID=94328 RepID=A0A8J5I811_ZINOF|nr:hypothetical protein ZIOFF_011436 [Zingiber officinale]